MQNHDKNNTVPETTMSGDKNINTIMRATEKIQISGNELMLIADVANGTLFNSWTGLIMTGSELEDFKHEIQDAEKFYKVGVTWDVSVFDLLLKYEHMPAAMKVEMVRHIHEAWRFHKDNLSNFLMSRFFPFYPSTRHDESPFFFLDARLKSGELVVNREPSHANPSDFNAILHALHRVSSNSRSFIEEEVQFSSVIGLTNCVKTSQNDDIVFALRKGRCGLSRFVRCRTPQESKSVFVVLKRASAQKYVLITGFIGAKPEPEPWDLKAFERASNSAHARAKSRVFWAGHALIFNSKDIIQGTETAFAPTCF